MMGYKVRNLKTHSTFSLDDLVPKDNFYRQVEQCIDLSFVRVLVCHLYSDFGRPSIDPVVFFKLQLIGFFEGIRSERLPVETVSLNLAHRWFIGYDLDEALPDLSSSPHAISALRRAFTPCSLSSSLSQASKTRSQPVNLSRSTTLIPWDKAVLNTSFMPQF